MSDITAYRSAEIEVPVPKLKQAAAAWMGLVFGFCYLGLPALTDLLGLWAWSGINFAMGAVGFAAVLALTLRGIGQRRPAIQLHADVRDPVIAATAGGLLTWGVIHSVGFGVLTPLAQMGAGELATFVAMNVVESALFGMMLASFARTRLQAFLLGVGFQGAFMALSMLSLLLGAIFLI